LSVYINNSQRTLFCGEACAALELHDGSQVSLLAAGSEKNHSQELLCIWAPVSNTDKATRERYWHPDPLFVTLRNTIWTAERWGSLRYIPSGQPINNQESLWKTHLGFFP